MLALVLANLAACSSCLVSYLNLHMSLQACLLGFSAVAVALKLDAAAAVDGSSVDETRVPTTSYAS